MRLPQIMVAPNGARRTTADHPAIPTTIPEIVTTTKQCVDEGADGLHAHVRDKQQRHVLDAGLYLELLAELKRELPGLFVQITTEAVGRYAPVQQRALVAQVRPAAVSVALSEMTSDLGREHGAVRAFYHEQAEAGTSVQHILYAPQDLIDLAQHMKQGLIPDIEQQVLFVLGRYSKDQQSTPDDLEPFVKAMDALPYAFDWAVCAFGRNETLCLVEAARAGGKVRVGFENALWNANGSVAKNNAERVREVRNALQV